MVRFRQADGNGPAVMELDGCAVTYLQKGSGPDLVWVPGGDQTCDIYHAQFAFFQDDFRCTSFDPRGAGGTKSLTPPPWPISVHAADCAALIREVCDAPVILIGMSLGALITQEVAISYPDLVRIAIPIATGAKKSGFYREWEDAEIALVEAGHSLPLDFRLVHYAALSYPSEVLGDDALWEQCKPYLLAAYGERDPEMQAAQWRACLEYDSTSRLPDCTVPMHVIAFSQDLQTPPSRGRVVAGLAGNGHFHILKGLGHMSMFGHRPETVSHCIRDIIMQYA